MTRQFRENLADAADEARFVDLSSRVRTASRRQTVQRTIITCTILVIALVTGATGLTRFQFHTVSDPADFGEIGGDFIYIGGDSDDNVEILRQSGETVTSVLALSAEKATGGITDVSISPTGRWAAWETDGTGGYRSVMVTDLITKEEVEAVSYDTGNYRNCLFPTWSPNGEPRLLTVAPEENTTGVEWFELDSKETGPPISIGKEKSVRLCELYPAGGAVVSDYNLFYGTDNGFEIRYLASDGTFHNTKAIEKLGAEAEPDWDVLTGVSTDGTTACVGTVAAEESSTLDRPCEAMIDLRTGSLVRDFRDSPATQVLFTRTGDVITRNVEGVIQRINAAGKTVAQVTEKKQFADDVLAAFIPD